MRSRMDNRLRSFVLTAVGGLLLSAAPAHAQHAGDIGLRVADGNLEVYGPIGNPDTGGIYLGTFGDSGFPGFTSNPGFDAFPGTLPGGRIGFNVEAGLRRWDPDSAGWLDPESVGERLRISFITLQTFVEDEPVAGFDLAVQGDGGWHKHVNFTLQPDAVGTTTPGAYRLDLVLYSTAGLGDSQPFTIVFDFEADETEVSDALASLEPAPPCPADLDDDGEVGGSDFGRLLAFWGSSDPDIDLNGDGVVNGGDVGVLLAVWGQCPE